MRFLLLANEITVIDFREFIERVKEIYESWGVAAAIGLPFLETLFPFLPLFLMNAFNMLSYGPVIGYIYSYVGTVLGTIVIFLFMRYISTKEFKRHRKEKPRVKKVLNWIEHTHPVLHILVLMIPFSPTFMINYSMGLTKMKWQTFLFITMVSRGLLLFICVPFGITLINYYNNGVFGGVEVLWLSIMGLVVLASIVAGQIITKRIKYN